MGITILCRSRLLLLGPASKPPVGTSVSIHIICVSCSALAGIEKALAYNLTYKLVKFAT